MKKGIFLLFFFVPPTFAASESTLLKAVITPPLPTLVIDNMIKQSIAEVTHSKIEAFDSSIGKIYLAMHAMGGIDTLCYIPPVVEQAQSYARTIVADRHLEGLRTVAKQLKDENKPEFERAVAWTNFDCAYRMLQKKLVEADIPGLILLATPHETIKHNTHIVLDDTGRRYFSAALLSIGLSMQEQFNNDPITFYLIFKQWIPAELKAQIGSIINIFV